MNKLEKYVKDHEEMCVKNDTIRSGLFEEYGVKKGLRDLNGQGVLTGLTNISSVKAFEEVDGQKVQEVKIVYNFVGEIPEIAA